MSRQAIVVGSDGNVRPFVAGGPMPARGRRIIFFVHGFNNDQHEAGASFSDMRRGIDRLLQDAGYGDARRRDVQRTIWEVHWPGYVQFSVLSHWRDRRNRAEKATTAALYGRQVIKARGWVADALAHYCASLGPANVFFVAHSLGCRLTLEVIRRLSVRIDRPIRVDGVLLMAGAVALHELAPARLGGSTQQLEHRFCFYSWRDRVLLLAFPPGQAAAGEVPVYLTPIAVGLTGKPSGMWKTTRNTRYGHGDYWKGALSAPATAEAAAALRAAFGMTMPEAAPPQVVPVTSTLAEHAPPEMRPPERSAKSEGWLEAFCA